MQIKALCDCSLLRFREYCPTLRSITKMVLVMKFIIVLLTAGFVHVHATGLSQTVTLSAKDLPLKQVFTAVQRQTGFLFFYNTTILQGTHPVNITVINMRLESFMDKLLANQPLEYTIKNNTIFISEKKPGAGQRTTQPEAPVQAMVLIDVKGRVYNQQNEPLEGISITVKGSNKGTMSDAKGEFLLRDVEENAILQISSVNYQSQEIPLNGQKEMAIRLKIRTDALGVVNVTVSNGYQDIPRERSTGSFVVIKGEQLHRRMAPDLLSRLDGVAGGLQFDRRELAPGRDKMNTSAIMIRGMSTLTESIKAPLIVLDNFPYDGDINSINPYDVESVTVLRDAAAASIWGARAANGVIVITTKKGKLNQPLEIAFTSNINIHAKPDLFRFPTMSTADFIDMETYLFQQGQYNAGLNSNRYRGLSPVVELLNLRRKGLLSAADSAAKLDALRQKDVRHDFDKYIYRTGIEQLYTINLSGGTDKLSFAVSGSYATMPTFLRGIESKRITVNAYQTYKPIKNLSVNLKINYSNSEDQFNTLGNYGELNYRYGGFYYMSPYTSFKDEQGNNATYPKEYREGFTDTAGRGALLDWKYRLLQELENKDIGSRVQEVLINAGLQYNLTRTLSASVSYQYRTSSQQSFTNYNLQTYFTRNLINQYTNLRATDGPTRNPVPIGGIRDEGIGNDVSQDGRVQINYNELLNGRHQVNVVVAADIRKNRRSTSQSRLYGYNEDNLSFSDVNYTNTFPLFGNMGSRRIASGRSLSEGTNNFVSLLANAAYTYNDRYTFTASARRDAANVFGVATNNQWKPFWSAGIGWKASNESFFQVPAIHNLAFRLTYGYQGNVNNTLSPLTIISYEQAASRFGLYSANISVAANPDLRWENQRQWNLAMDISLLKGRLSAGIDLWRKRSEDVISYQQMDPTTGVLRVSSNSATLGANGIDIELRSVNLRGPFEWKTEIAISTAKNKALKLDTIYYGDVTFAGGILGSHTYYSLAQGRDPYALYSFPFAGLDPATGDPLGYLGGKLSKEYNQIYYQGVDTAGMIYHGSSRPMIFGFVNNIFSYKGVQLVVGLTYNLKYFFRRVPINYSQMVSNGLMHPDYDKRWKRPGDELHTTVPSFTYPANYDRDEFYRKSSVNVLRGDNVKISNLRLSYEMMLSGPVKKIIRRMLVSASCQNLGTLWMANKEKIDPDMDYGASRFPRPLTVGIGIQLTF